MHSNVPANITVILLQVVPSIGWGGTVAPCIVQSFNIRTIEYMAALDITKTSSQHAG